mmetsp:Transcript_33297/g.85104  ORF Transcript_33297/g.85104 Transcript_33297/m.85104 type:complete len:314 (+) Transcript_33297:584-1525(+)
MLFDLTQKREDVGAAHERAAGWCACRTLDASRNAWKSLSSDSVPPGLDRESYMAGERSAMLRLFQEVLPSQQALGALAAAVQRLQDDMAGLAEVEGTAKAVQAGLHAVKDRVVELEHRRLPALEVRMDAVQHSAAPEELVRVLQALHGLNEGMMSAHEAERLWTRKSALQRALISVRSWLVGSVSQMDVALLFLSRRLLLGSYSGEASGSEGGAASARGKWSGHRAAVGAALFVAFVEAGWRAQKAGVSHLPWPANRLVKPLRPGLSVLRTLCWTAVLTLGAHEVRRLCFSAAFLGTDRHGAKPGQECTEPRP